MNIFETKTGARIDIVALNQVLLGERKGTWCLDTQDGSVKKCASTIICARIPRIAKQKVEQSMRNFITESDIFVLDEDDEAFVRTLKQLRTQEHVLGDALTLLQGNSSWMFAWTQWRNDDFWDDLVEWLEDTVPDITEVLELDCSCAMCHVLAEHYKQSGDNVRLEWVLDDISSK